jgi:hypothetical protein
MSKFVSKFVSSVDHAQLSKRLLGTTDDSVYLLVADDGEVGIGVRGMTYDDDISACYLRPKEARELAAHLNHLADWLEGRDKVIKEHLATNNDFDLVYEPDGE